MENFIMASACVSIIRFDHSFGQEKRNPLEWRMIVITLVALVVMAAEIAAGKWTGSMALFSDGVHMGTHVLALGLASAATIIARRHARNRIFSFGSGKVGDLAGFSSAVILGISAGMLVVESVERLLRPTPIAYGEALLVATIGLVVNGVSVYALSGSGHHHHHHGRDCGSRDRHSHDNNLRAALVHMAADALTSAAAIVALLAAWKLGWNWLDPLVALLAAALIGIWAWGLLRDTGRVLLDMEAPEETRQCIISALEADGDSRVIDLHVWSIGPGGFTLVAAVVTHQGRKPDDYRSQLPGNLAIHHPIIEVRQCQNCC